MHYIVGIIFRSGPVEMSFLHGIGNAMNGCVVMSIVNNSATSVSSALFLGQSNTGTNKAWEFGTDHLVNGTDEFYIRCNSTNLYPLIQRLLNSPDIASTSPSRLVALRFLNSFT